VSPCRAFLAGLAAAGVAEVVEKPFDGAKLLAAIARAIPLSSSPATDPDHPQFISRVRENFCLRLLHAAVPGRNPRPDPRDFRQMRVKSSSNL
jgi:hypothetical protein